MSKLRALGASLLLALAALPSSAHAQGRGEVAGQVTASETGEPLSGVQVRVQGTTQQVVTDAGGRYRMGQLSAGTHTLAVSLVGRSASSRTITIVAGQTTTANFQLSPSAVLLEGVVVNAVTGQQERRREAGTNTSNINVGDLNMGPITKVADVLTGRTTGVTLQGAAGTTGTAQRIRIRGANSLSLSNEPLVYIDGVLANTNPLPGVSAGIAVGGQQSTRLNDLNPDDIENIEVLKGPAASALYGTAAANGVLLITTRRGRSGQTVWRGYVESGSIEDVNQYPLNYATVQGTTRTDTTIYNPLTGGFATGISLCSNEASTRAVGAPGKCTQGATYSFNQFRDPRTTPFSTGLRRKAGLNVSGGTANLTYYLSGDREAERGVIDYNTLSRTNLRANLNAQLRPNLTAQVNAGYIRTDLQSPQGDNNVFSPLINGLTGPGQYIPGMESATIGRQFASGASQCVTPTCGGRRLGAQFNYNNADMRFVVANQQVDRFLLGANSNFRPTSWLSLNANSGLDFFSRFDQQTIDPNNLPLANSYVIGFRDARRANNYQYTLNGTAVGTFEVSSALTTTTTAGLSFQQQRFGNVTCYGEAILVGTDSCGGSTAQFAVNEDDADNKIFGIFGRQEIALNDRLFVAASLRGDRNSGLVEDFVIYPSASASWVVSEEPFFPQTSFLSNLRLRAAAGRSGLRPSFGDAESFSRAVPVELAATTQIAAVPTSTGNPTLKPEITTEYEAGVDVGLLDDRLAADFTVYTKRSQDALVQRPLAPSQGLTSPAVSGGQVFQNLGSIRNSGTELGINALLLDRTNTRLNVRLALTTLENEIEDLGEGIAPIVFGRGPQNHREGFPTGAFFATPYTFADANGDGLISRTEVKVDSSRFLVVPTQNASRKALGLTSDTLNFTYAGPSLPTNTQSFSADLTLFGTVSITTLFERRAGHKQLNFTEYFRCRSATQSQCNATGNPKADLADQARYVASTAPAVQGLGATAFGYIEDGEFIKWRELSLRVGVPDRLGQNLPALRGASVTFSGRNLKTWTDYTGLDPEINETGAGSNFTQGEFNTQPPVRYFTVRLDLSF
jgi:TonB-linked SusC/RagA family outer membrane protein